MGGWFDRQVGLIMRKLESEVSAFRKADLLLRFSFIDM